ncbi:hypothetical protein [Pacificibacter marinus]|uniref:hypothetical protein n=1 Tax=Pacificibacter marinus TaxID=658057 RepID=UPI001C0A1B91|nr:hypothetical protein [Pacificibacter marinus]MBU2935043.1 hypothetical protein [Pacificibacter marinus]
MKKRKRVWQAADRIGSGAMKRSLPIIRCVSPEIGGAASSKCSRKYWGRLIWPLNMMPKWFCQRYCRHPISIAHNPDKYDEKLAEHAKGSVFVVRP